MAIEQGLQAFGSIFQDTTVFGLNWIIALLLTLITLLLISKEPNDWKTIALPVTTLYHAMGITPSFLQYLLASIIFAIEIFSLQTIGNTIDVFRQHTTKLIKPNETKTLTKKFATLERNRRLKESLRETLKKATKNPLQSKYLLTSEQLDEYIKKGK